MATDNAQQRALPYADPVFHPDMNDERAYVDRGVGRGQHLVYRAWGALSAGGRVLQRPTCGSSRTWLAQHGYRCCPIG